MPDGVKKAVCPHCGSEAECFCRLTTNGALLADKYIRWCPTCEKQETRKVSVGYRIVDRDNPQKTICPFCGRPPDKHRQGLSEEEVIYLMHRRGEKDDSPRSPEHSREEPVTARATPPPRTNGDEVVLPCTPKKKPAAASVLPPPRARRRIVKTAKTVTSRDIWKLMILLITPLYMIALGVSVFIAFTNEGAPFLTAVYAGLTTAGVTFVMMIAAAVLIVRDFREQFDENLQRRT